MIEMLSLCSKMLSRAIGTWRTCLIVIDRLEVVCVSTPFTIFLHFFTIATNRRIVRTFTFYRFSAVSRFV